MRRGQEKCKGKGKVGRKGEGRRLMQLKSSELGSDLGRG